MRQRSGDFPPITPAVFAAHVDRLPTSLFLFVHETLSIEHWSVLWTLLIALVIGAPHLSRYGSGEWLKLLTYEIADVARIAREGALVQLAPVPGMHEELDRTAHGQASAQRAIARKKRLAE